MITRERTDERTADSPLGARPEDARPGGGGNTPPPPRGRGDGWWRNWPSPPNRPRPINRGSLWRGAAVVTPALLIVDGVLGVMAWQATGHWYVGLAVGGVLFGFTGLEFAIVAWAVKKRQDEEIRRSRT